MEAILPYIIVCPLVFLAGFVDAIAGGGGLISLPAYMISGIPVHMSIATNKLSSSMGTALATARYAKLGYIPLREALFCIVCALAGATVGAKLALCMDDRVFKIVMLIILPLTAAYVLFGKGLQKGDTKPVYTKTVTVLISMGAALIIGVYDGFYGPGTGTFLILLLTGFARMPLEKANGITKTINLTSNITALTVFLINGKVLLPLGLVAGCFSIAGNYMGTRCFTAGGVKFVRPVIVIVLVIFFVRVLLELLA